MNKILFIVFLISNFFCSQNLHIEYVNKNSELTSFKENLYISPSSIVSISDSITVDKLSKDPEVSRSNEKIFMVKDKLYKTTYFKNNPKTLTIKEYIGNQVYFVQDKLPEIIWNTNYVDKKIILGYNCMKATTFFRGSNVIVYFTKDIKVSTGPYKFGGLDGLILEAYEEISSINHWIATKIEKTNKKAIISPMIPKNSEMISLQNFLVLKQNKVDEDYNEMMKKIPVGVGITVSRNKIKRVGI